jgi:predicted GIY-YIG superfamily endonuclease
MIEQISPTIYTIELENSKFYIGRSNIPKQRILNHFKENGSEWTKLYKPIKIISQIKGDNIDEEKYTLLAMKKYGIDNVRGGAFCKLNLTSPEIIVIKQILLSIDDKCYKCGLSGHFIKDCNMESVKISINRIIGDELSEENGSNIDNQLEENDSPEKYDIFKNKNLLHLIEASYSASHNDVALLFYKLNKNILKCAKEEPRIIWYILVDGVWIRLEGQSKIKLMINKMIILYKNHRTSLSIKSNDDTISDCEKDRIDLSIIKIDKLISKLKHRPFITEIISQSIQYFKEDNFIEKLDVNPNILCFGKYLFDLKKCDWRETLPTDCCSLKCGITKDEINDEYVEFLNQIFLDIFTTEERRQYMLNQFSMFLNGNNTEQLFYIWLGAGANGKSLIQDYFMAAFGDYFCDLPTSLITQKEGKATDANPELCRGRGRRVAFFSEPEEGTKANNSILKKWSGGERISCRALYENSSTYNVLFKIIILCNTKFELQDIQDDSVTRRVVYTNFKTKFDYDPKFEFQKLRVDEYKTTEYINKIKGSFMFMLLSNYTKLKNVNFKFLMPKDMIDDRDEFMDNNNETKVFIKSEYIKTNSEKDYVTAKDMYANFKCYLKNNDIKMNIKERDFKNRIMKDIPYKDRIKPVISGKQTTINSVFLYIKLKSDEEEI